MRLENQNNLGWKEMLEVLSPSPLLKTGPTLMVV